MSSRTPLLVAAAIGLATLHPSVGGAQLAIDADVAFNSAYVWRGVTSTNRFVINPTLLLSAPVGKTTLTLGGWTNVEPARYDGARDLSPLEGEPGPALTSSQVWVELEREVGPATITLGITRYLYPDVADLSDTYASNEAYGTLSLGGALSPSLTLAYDVEKVRGAYVELGLARELALPLSRTRRQPLALSAAAGWSAGQAEDPSAHDAAYFTRDGLTHLDLGAATTFALGGVEIEPSAHLVVARDEMARLVAPDELRRVKGWFGVSLSWSGSVGGERAK
ncbi:MAG TPA: hypothetical protein VEA99_01125 [Gemmatimonadaceae bacterium]|nr:hypothetical protein [Gemmatimonadaceae bacterium]